MIFSVREMIPNDYEALCRLFEQVDTLHQIALPHLFKKPDGPARTREYVDQFIDGGDLAILVAQADKRLAGFCSIIIQETPPIPLLVFRRYALVDTIGVDPHYRRHGVGQALMQRAEQWALQHGATSVELSVYLFNQGARDFYDSLGYSAISQKMSKKLVNS